MHVIDLINYNHSKISPLFLPISLPKNIWKTNLNNIEIHYVKFSSFLNDTAHILNSHLNLKRLAKQTSNVVSTDIENLNITFFSEMMLVA
jgi:hypothetical protein